MSTPNPTHIIAEGMREIATEGRKGTPGTRDDGQLWGAFPNTMTLTDLAAHVVSKLTDAGYSIVRVECDGSGTCPVSLHIHGCFSDDGNNCDNPEDHICDCGTCVAIEAARAERAAAAEGEKP